MYIHVNEKESLRNAVSHTELMCMGRTFGNVEG